MLGQRYSDSPNLTCHKMWHRRNAGVDRRVQLPHDLTPSQSTQSRRLNPNSSRGSSWLEASVAASQSVACFWSMSQRGVSRHNWCKASTRAAHTPELLSGLGYQVPASPSSSSSSLPLSVTELSCRWGWARGPKKNKEAKHTQREKN